MRNLTDTYYYADEVLYVCSDDLNKELTNTLAKRSTLIFKISPYLKFEKDRANSGNAVFNPSEITEALTLLAIGSVVKINETNQDTLFRSFQRTFRDVVIYHGNCPDGTMSAAIYKYMTNNENTVFIEGKHGTVDTDFENCNIFFLDFSYPLEGMQELLKKRNAITIIDHHKTAIEMLEKLGHQHALTAWVDPLNEKSGAYLTWTYFANKYKEDISVPKLVDFISKRDTWTQEWKNGDKMIRRVLAYLDSFDTTIENYEEALFNSINDTNWFHNAEGYGDAILRYKQGIIDQITSSQLRMIRMFSGNYNVAVLNCNSEFCSEVGNAVLAKNPHADFVLLYNFGSKGIKISLRSTDERVDVTTIAKELSVKGGGHRNAAGAFLPYLGADDEDPVETKKYIKLLSELQI